MDVFLRALVVGLAVGIPVGLALSPDVPKLAWRRLSESVKDLFVK